MGIYKLSARELADLINKALENTEGDFDLEELEKALVLVKHEQDEILSDSVSTSRRW